MWSVQEVADSSRFAGTSLKSNYRPVVNTLEASDSYFGTGAACGRSKQRWPIDVLREMTKHCHEAASRVMSTLKSSLHPHERRGLVFLQGGRTGRCSASNASSPVAAFNVSAAHMRRSDGRERERQTSSRWPSSAGGVTGRSHCGARAVPFASITSTE